MKDLELLVTLWPSAPHFERFAQDYRLAGIRLNSAMVKGYELDSELALANKVQDPVPLYFDIKGKQLRVTEVFPYDTHLELTLNHPIKVRTPTGVLFKGGEDYCLLERVVDGNRLIFDGGPAYMVHEGESLHIRDPGLIVGGPTFCDFELEKIDKARKAGFERYFLSYVEDQAAIDEFRELVGHDAELVAKIENVKGLRFVAEDYKPQPRLNLMAAQGDLYVEINKPHEIMSALRLIIGKDPQAMVGSRLMLSAIHQPVPSCADLSQLAYLYDIGYRRMMFCDELCLKGDLLGRAVNMFEAFRNEYAKDAPDKQARAHQEYKYTSIWQRLSGKLF